MPKYDLDTIANLQNESSVVSTINANMVIIETALDDALFRDGDGAASDNAMQGDLDMNSQRILNLPVPSDDLEPARHGDIQTYVTDAQTAKTAAETAQTAAELAETNAETAETNAETAETNAQAILDEVNTLGINSGAYTPVALGTVTTGIQPEPSDGSMQTMTNGGAFTLTAPSETGWYRLVYTNNGSAGIISQTGFDAVFDSDTNLEHVVENSIIELLVTNDGVANILQVTLLVDATP